MKTEIEQLLEMYNAKNPNLPVAASPDDCNIVMATPEDGATKNAAALLVAQGGSEHFTGQVTLKYNRIPAPQIPDITIATDLSRLPNVAMWGIMSELWGEKFGDNYTVNPPPGSPLNNGIGEVDGWDHGVGECPIIITGLKYIGDENGVTNLFTINFVDGTDDIKEVLRSHLAKVNLATADGALDGFA